MPDPFDLHFDKARRAFAEGYADHALVPATEAVKLAPERWDARLLLARVWLAQGGTARAAADARAAIELARGAMPLEALREAREVIAVCALKSNDLDTAETELRELVLSGEPKSVARLVSLLADRGRRDDARTVASDAVSRHPEMEPALTAAALALAADDSLATNRALGDLALAAGAADDARARFQTVLTAAPDDAAAIEGLRRAASPGGAASEPAQIAGDLGVLMRWASSLFVALGIALVVFSFWRRDAILENSAFPPEYWAGAGGVSLALGVVVLLLFSRKPDRP